MYHTCKFSALTIYFSEVWPSKILDLGKQLTLMIRLENNFARRLLDVFKTSWRRFWTASWRRFEDVLVRRLEDILKTPRRCLEDVFVRRLEDVLKAPWRRLEDVLKTSWRCLEDVWPRRIYSSWSRRLEDIFKTLSEEEDERRLHQDECLPGSRK